MQINSITNQNFNARLQGDFSKIKDLAIKNGYKFSKARELERKMRGMLPNDCTITAFLPQEGSVTGRVILENWKGSGVDMNVCPVLLDKRNLLVKYFEAAEALAKTDFSKNRGLYTIA